MEDRLSKKNTQGLPAVTPLRDEIDNGEGYNLENFQATPENLARVYTIGIDIGFGVTKVVAAEKTLSFRSVSGYARDLKFQWDEIVAKYPGDFVHDDQGEWFVGDLALSQLKENELLYLQGRSADEVGIGNEFRVRMFKAALGKLFHGLRGGDNCVVHVNVATGLPVDHVKTDAPLLKAALAGSHRIKTNSADFVANVQQVIVMPQPYGVIFSQQFTEAGDFNRGYTYKRTGVIDVGFYTVDLVVDDENEYIDAESGSIEGGVYTAFEKMALILEKQDRQKPPYRTVEQVLRSGVRRERNTLVSYEDKVLECLAPLRSSTKNFAVRKWQAGVDLDVIYVAGGGGEWVLEEVQTAFPQAILLPEPALAIARGFRNYAKGKVGGH
jgi:hypothetical protein